MNSTKNEKINKNKTEQFTEPQKTKKKRPNFQKFAEDYKRTRSDKDFTLLYTSMFDIIKLYVNNIVNDIDLSQDIADNVFIIVMSSIDGYDPTRSRFTTWLYTIAHNEAMSALKDIEKRRTSPLDSFDESDDSNTQRYEKYIVSDDGISESEAISQSETFDKKISLIMDEMDKLPDDYKNVMIERFIGNKSYEELVGCVFDKNGNSNLGTVKNKIHKGRQILIAQLMKNEEFKTSAKEI